MFLEDLWYFGGIFQETWEKKDKEEEKKISEVYLPRMTKVIEEKPDWIQQGQSEVIIKYFYLLDL